jgi:hypothetical protein
MSPPLSYYKSDERPAWQATIYVNGSTESMASGYTFSVKLATSAGASPTLTKTSGITGAAAGVVTVAWASGELNIAVGMYVAHLTATRTSDGAEWTVSELIDIKERL